MKCPKHGVNMVGGKCPACEKQKKGEDYIESLDITPASGGPDKDDPPNTDNDVGDGGNGNADGGDAGDGGGGGGSDGGD